MQYNNFYLIILDLNNAAALVAAVYSHRPESATIHHRLTVANIASAHASSIDHVTPTIVCQTLWTSVNSNVPTWTITISVFKDWIQT